MIQRTVIAEACGCRERATAGVEDQTEQLRGAGAEPMITPGRADPPLSWKVQLTTRWWREKCWKQGSRRTEDEHMVRNAG